MNEKFLDIYKNVVKIERDTDPMSPRCDSIGKLIIDMCAHEINETDIELTGIDKEDLKKLKKISNKGFIIPVYYYYTANGKFHFTVYAHYSDFGAGKAGWIFVDKKTIREIYQFKFFSTGKKKIVFKDLEKEVEEYSHYWNDEVYYFWKEDKDGNKITENSKDFYGYNHEQSGLREAALISKIDYLIRRTEEIKMALKEE